MDVVHDGQLASSRLADAEYDLVVLDLMVPGQSGLEACRQLRAANKDAAILMLTARNGIDARMVGLYTPRGSTFVVQLPVADDVTPTGASPAGAAIPHAEAVVGTRDALFVPP